MEELLWESFEKEEISAEEFYATADYLMSECLPISSMLNGKYVIGNHTLYDNSYAFGNCWYANDFISAASPDEELALLGEIDLYETAIIGEDFAWAREFFNEENIGSAEDYISLTYYAPNELRYEFGSKSERAAIFSEIYYPKGWKAWIEPTGACGKVVDGRYQPTSEGKEIELFRANWILRGAIVPAGEGQIIMRFEPESYRTGESISRISSILLILLLLGSMGAVICNNRKARN